MILAYALGGGLGHLVRTRAVLHTLGVEDGAAIVTSSRFADDPRVVGDVPVIRVPAALDGDRAGLRRWFADLVAAERPERVILDAFPGGILGELGNLDVPVDHVARLLRWPTYERRLRGPLPPIETTFVLEPLHGAHEDALRAASGRLVPLELVDPPAPESAPLLTHTTLVVHAGPADEVAWLMALASRRADGRRIIVASPTRPAALPSSAWLDIHPAAALFAQADAIVTGAGFNAMRQAAPYRDRHRFLAFPRPLDDQPARALLARARQHA